MGSTEKMFIGGEWVEGASRLTFIVRLIFILDWEKKCSLHIQRKNLLNFRHENN